MHKNLISKDEAHRGPFGIRNINIQSASRIKISYYNVLFKAVCIFWCNKVQHYTHFFKISFKIDKNVRQFFSILYGALYSFIDEMSLYLNSIHIYVIFYYQGLCLYSNYLYYVKKYNLFPIKIKNLVYKPCSCIILNLC